MMNGQPVAPRDLPSGLAHAPLPMGDEPLSWSIGAMKTPEGMRVVLVVSTTSGTFRFRFLPEGSEQIAAGLANAAQKARLGGLTIAGPGDLPPGVLDH